MISAFEYVTVFISIILGLGVTQILTGIADLIHQNRRVKIYWPHLIWVLLVLILHVQEWWVTFELRGYGPWRLPVFLFIILYPVVLFVLARLLFPFGFTDGEIDLKKFYFENYRKIFLFGAILGLLSILDSFIVRPLMWVNLIGPTVVMTSLSWMALSKKLNTWIHVVMPIFMLTMITVTIIIEWNKWLVAN
ncbi:MAG: hypothetical protein JST48_02195 [Bacteroidetes bacterium]|nr:hypothetical protein [Bacteroidota bacterium]